MTHILYIISSRTIRTRTNLSHTTCICTIKHTTHFVEWLYIQKKESQKNNNVEQSATLPLTTIVSSHTYIDDTKRPLSQRLKNTPITQHYRIWRSLSDHRILRSMWVTSKSSCENTIGTQDEREKPFISRRESMP